MSSPKPADSRETEDITFMHDSSPDFLPCLSELQKCQHLTDVFLKADELLLPCHRVVLSAASPYFHAMFTSGSEESASGTVEIKSIDHTTLQSIIDYVYSGEINITTDNVKNLVQFSTEYQFESIKQACKQKLQELDDLETKKSEDMHFVDTSFSAHFMQCLSEMRESQQLTNVSLKAEGVFLPCHRVVLSAASPYFRAMFTSGFKESASATVELENSDHATLQSIIEHVYSGEINITSENMKNLVQVSSKYQFASVKQACEKYLQQQVNYENCISLYKFASLFSLKVLQEEAWGVMLANLKSVVCTAEFEGLTETELVKYISDSDLVVPDEDIVFHAVVLWVNSDLPSRGDAFERVVARVRLPYCTGTYLCHVVGKQPLMSAPVCQRYLEEARRFHCMPDRRHEMVNQRTVPRKQLGDKCQLVVIGGLRNSFLKSERIWCLEDDCNSWKPLTKLPIKCWREYNACVTQDGILLTGGLEFGEKYTETVSLCYLFDTLSEQWKSFPSLRIPRQDHSVVAHCDQMYAIGGFGGLDHDYELPSSLDSVECFDKRSNRWKKVAPMKKPVTDPTAVSFGDNIYVFGGSKEDCCTATQKYDRVRGEWSLRAELPEPCSGTAVTVNEKIFLIGRSSDSCKALSYSPAMDTWTTLTVPPLARCFGPAVIWKGRILISATADGGNAVEYDPEEDTWSSCSFRLNDKASCHSMLSVDLRGRRMRRSALDKYKEDHPYEDEDDDEEDYEDDEDEESSSSSSSSSRLDDGMSDDCCVQ